MIKTKKGMKAEVRRETRTNERRSWKINRTRMRTRQRKKTRKRKQRNGKKKRRTRSQEQ